MWRLPYIHVFWGVSAPPETLVGFVHVPVTPTPGSLIGEVVVALTRPGLLGTFAEMWP